MTRDGSSGDMYRTSAGASASDASIRPAASASVGASALEHNAVVVTLTGDWWEADVSVSSATGMLRLRRPILIKRGGVAMTEARSGSMSIPITNVDRIEWIT